MSSESSVDPTATEGFEVVVVGAGQAGLAIGHFLARDARSFVILEAGAAVGTAWRVRWDSLTLFTPRRYDFASWPGLPGRAGRLPDPATRWSPTWRRTRNTFALRSGPRAPVTSLASPAATGFV